MLKRFRGLGLLKPYLIFSLTDETFALFSSMPEIPDNKEKLRLFMSCVSVMTEQIIRIKKPGVFIVSAAAALLGVFLLQGNVSIFAFFPRQLRRTQKRHVSFS